VTATDAAPAVPFYRRLPGRRLLKDGSVLYWWGEIAFIGIYYFVYSAIRNTNKSGAGEARRNAIELIDWQKALGLNHERMLQEWALNFKPLIIACNYFYGSLHFIVTSGVLIFIYRKFSDDYPIARNTLAISTGLALIGFAFFPLMPPRLMPASYGFVDTLDQDPAFWSFNRGAVNKISNQYAAMPSVHCAWALWCAVMLVPRLKRSWAKWLAALYPVGTITSIVLTANHYFLDVVGGFGVLGIGYVIARLLTRAGRGQPIPPEPDPPPPQREPVPA
jgi:hypothetical protein